MTHPPVSTVLPWALFVLGIGHIVYGLVKFRIPLARAVASGFVGKFSVPEDRRSAFWFLMFGPLLVLAGHVAIHAASVGDIHLIRVIGAYLLGVCVIGVLALPKSPFLLGLAISLLLLALGYGYI
jgi:hypothetical protein